MVDQEIAEQGLGAISKTLESILTEAHALTSSIAPSLAAHADRAASLSAAGDDLAVLVAAARILIRRAAPAV